MAMSATLRLKWQPMLNRIESVRAAVHPLTSSTLNRSDDVGGLEFPAAGRARAKSKWPLIEARSGLDLPLSVGGSNASRRCWAVQVSLIKDVSVVRPSAVSWAATACAPSGGKSE